MKTIPVEYVGSMHSNLLSDKCDDGITRQVASKKKYSGEA